MQNHTLTRLKGVKVGHSTQKNALTGCTVVTFDNACPVAYHASGGTPRLFDAHILDAGKSYFLKHAIFVADGAHAGLEAASEINKALREKGVGWKMGKKVNPSITGATVMGLNYDHFEPRYGHEAVQNATNEPVLTGNVGVGTGVSVGKFSWTTDMKCLAMKSGVGSALIDLGKGAYIAALTVVNALGNVINADGTILAGNRHDEEKPKYRTFKGFSEFLTGSVSNTTISIVGTNIKITSQEDLRRVAEIASHGQVRAINPVNTSLDADTVFAFTTNEVELPLTQLGKQIGNIQGEWWKLSTDIISQFAAEAVQKSIYDACFQAETISFPNAYKGIVPSVKDY